MPSPNFQIERVGEYSQDVAAGIGRLKPFLSKGADDCPMPEAELRPIIELPTMEQIIAIHRDQIVGSATLKLIDAEADEPTGWLDNFVTRPDLHGKGPADMIADEWEDWFRERNVMSLYFTSRWDRTRAHGFYLRRGARIISPLTAKSAVFLYPIPD